jgi:fructose-1,6-bisphosphatase I
MGALLYCSPVPPLDSWYHSATTVLVVTLGSGVDGFTLDPDQSKFLHTHRDIRIPSSGKIYSMNEGNFRDFDEPVRRYLAALKEGSSKAGSR